MQARFFGQARLTSTRHDSHDGLRSPFVRELNRGVSRSANASLRLHIVSRRTAMNCITSRVKLYVMLLERRDSPPNS